MTRRLLPILTAAALIATLAYVIAPEVDAELAACIREADATHRYSPLGREAYDEALRACNEAHRAPPGERE